MRWHLMILVCNALTAHCEWRHADSYRSEEACVLGALEIPNLEFRCRQRVESIPLPRARPLSAPP